MLVIVARDSYHNSVLAIAPDSLVTNAEQDLGCSIVVVVDSFPNDFVLVDWSVDEWELSTFPSRMN